MLTCLYHSSWYEAQLIAQPGDRRIATTFFNTSSIKGDRHIFLLPFISSTSYLLLVIDIMNDINQSTGRDMVQQTYKFMSETRHYVN